jgi:Sec-independent protein secretion pathway component TatC
MRRLCATVLACEAIVIGLAIPVAISIAGADGAQAGLVGGGLVVCCLVVAGLLRYRWAYVVGTILQILAIATGTVVTAMFFLGAIFGALWITAIWLGRRTEGVRAG